MKIAIIGASGFVGSALVKETLDRGHLATAISRNSGKLITAHEHMYPVSLDVNETDRLAAVLSGHDVVISAFNPGWTNPALYEEFLRGSESIQQAVKKAGVNRIIVIGGAGSLFLAPGLQLVDTPDFPADWKAGAQAARDYLNLLQKETELNWTFVSPAIEMHPGTSGERKGSYRIGGDHPVFDDRGRSVISVEDLAVAVLDEAEKPKHTRQRFTVAY